MTACSLELTTTGDKVEPAILGTCCVGLGSPSLCVYWQLLEELKSDEANSSLQGYPPTPGTLKTCCVGSRHVPAHQQHPPRYPRPRGQRCVPGQSPLSAEHWHAPPGTHLPPVPARLEGQQAVPLGQESPRCAIAQLQSTSAGMVGVAGTHAPRATLATPAEQRYPATMG